MRCKVNCEVNIKGNAILVPNYRKGNMLGLKTEQQKVNRRAILANTVEQMCSNFTNILLEAESNRK